MYFSAGVISLTNALNNLGLPNVKSKPKIRYPYFLAPTVNHHDLAAQPFSCYRTIASFGHVN
jgi:hypothetical protein